MADFMKLMEDWNAYTPVSKADSPEYLEKLQEVNDLIYGVGYAPHKRRYLLTEAMTTSDFPYLFGDVLDRGLLATYKAVQPGWAAYVKQSTLPDFRTGYRFAITDGDQRLPRVYEKGEYLASGREEERFSISLGKYGKQFDISWESIINDDLNALKDTAQRFFTSVLRTEHYAVVNQYAGDVSTHALNANLFQVGVNCTGNAFSVEELGVGLAHFALLRDDNGEPIFAMPKYLVVNPSLEIEARQVLTSAFIDRLYGRDFGPFQVGTANVIPSYGLTLIVDPYLPIADTTSPTQAWYLFCDPNDITSLEMAKLQGYENPEICMKASDKVAVGGTSPLPSMSGDFATDNILYRVRHVFGVASMDWRGCYMGGYQG